MWHVIYMSLILSAKYKMMNTTEKQFNLKKRNIFLKEFNCFLGYLEFLKPKLWKSSEFNDKHPK